MLKKNIMSKISKLVLNEPNAELMIIENGYIDKNTIYVQKDNLKGIFHPTLYKGWFNEKTNNNINFKEKDIIPDIDNNKILFIFDSFGLSSYYHLLIDTILPLWITKNIIFENLNLDKNTQVDFLNISDMSNENILKSRNTIFEYFLNNKYIESIDDSKYKYIIYGYCYNHRPYYGPNGISRYYLKYQLLFDRFYNTFTINEEVNEQYILIPLRIDSSYEHMDLLCETISKLYKTKIVDFSNYSIEEQIKLSNGAWAMVGSEGAAFSNQIFMKKKSLIICIGEIYNFHSSVSNYLEHNFYNISKNDEHCINSIINILKQYKSSDLH